LYHLPVGKLARNLTEPAGDAEAQVRKWIMLTSM
jgi:hypothetical protein